MQQILEKLYSYNMLEEGWDYGRGGPISKEVIDKALEIVNMAPKYNLSIEIFPGDNGELEVSLYREDHFLDFTINNDGDLTIDFIYEIGIGFMWQDVVDKHNISIPEVELECWRLSRLWNFSPLRECPFCKKFARIIPVEHTTEREKFIVFFIGCNTLECFCSAFERKHFGRDEVDKAVERWNRRATV